MLATMQTRYFGVRVYIDCGGYARYARFKKRNENREKQKDGSRELWGGRCEKIKILSEGLHTLHPSTPSGGHICIYCDCNKCTIYI